MFFLSFQCKNKTPLAVIAHSTSHSNSHTPHSFHEMETAEFVCKEQVEYFSTSTGAVICGCFTLLYHLTCST